MLAGATVRADEEMDVERLLSVWRGDDADAVAAAAVVGTAAIALRLLGRADGPEDAEAQARSLWENRPGSPLALAGAA
jgi:hypothetical protein